jgi:hypothetical protein
LVGRGTIGKVVGALGVGDLLLEGGAVADVGIAGGGKRLTHRAAHSDTLASA